MCSLAAHVPSPLHGLRCEETKNEDFVWSGDFEEPRRAAPTGAAMYVQCRLFEIKHACNLTKNKQAERLAARSVDTHTSI
jgi:hypothetical protein